MAVRTHVIACHCRYNSGDEDNFSQPSIFWKKTLKPEERERLVQNIVDHLKDAADFIQVSCCPPHHSSYLILLLFLDITLTDL
jgi:catalase